MAAPALRRGARRLSRLPPPAVLLVLYGAFAALGTLLLRLPLSHAGAVGWSEAAFTAVSAVTVTGLVVVDTGSDFTLFGQVVIACLIQFGGLGLMVAAIVVLMALGVRIGLPSRMMLREELNQPGMGGLPAVAKLVLTVAAACEIVGAALLAFVFVPQFGWGHGLWQAVFHSISAFNNAGFSLFSAGLTGYVGDPVVNLVIPALFILGGLGFIVIGDLIRHRAWGPLAVHSKLMLVGTGILIALGCTGFAALEWHNPGTLAPLGTGAKLWASWFQGVTPRTAGFNTVDTGAITDSAALMTMVLMVIGAGSTSTGGGLKVTTFIVMLLATLAFFRRRETLTAFGRSLGTEQVMKAMALVAISLGIVIIAMFLVTLGAPIDFLPMMFEVTSAFGTVGLSMGATGELDGWQRAVIIAVMFFGRVGPLTLGFFLANLGPGRVRYPPGQVHLG